MRLGESILSYGFFLAGWQFICESAGRAVDEKRYEYQQRRRGEAYGICRHYSLEIVMFRKHQFYPRYSYSADSDHCKHCRNQRNAEAAQITGHYLI